MLTHNIAKGGSVAKKDGTKFVYSVSAKNPEVALPDESVSSSVGTSSNLSVAAEEKTKITSELVQDIPVFAARADDLLIPAFRLISDEIRNTPATLSLPCMACIGLQWRGI